MADQSSGFQVLQSTGTDFTPNTSGLIPAYMDAANNHNLASGNSTWFEDLGQSILNAPKYFELAAASGVLGMANTGIAVANIFKPTEDKIQELNLSSWLGNYDDDLAKYYENNKASIDSTGFLLGSLVPGTIGVKAFNIGQKVLEGAIAGERIGGNMAKAAGILVPKIDKFVDAAAQETALTSTATKLITANKLKALGLKAYQGGLDTVAFQTAALATQFKSPFLSDQSASDIALDFGINAFAGGILGGVIAIPGVNRSIKNIVESADIKGMPGLLQKSAGSNADDSIKATNAMLNRKRSEDFIAKSKEPIPEGSILPTADEQALTNVHITRAKDNIQDLNNQITQSVQGLTDNTEVANIFARAILGADSASAAGMFNTTSKLIRQVEAVGLDAAETKAQQKAADVLAATGGNPTDAARVTDTTWHQLWGFKGDVTGQVDGLLPRDKWIADVIPLKGKDSSLTQAVDSYTKSLGHKQTVPVNVFDPDELTPIQVQTRYLAATTGKMNYNKSIGGKDIPYLERGMNDLANGKTDSVKVNVGTNDKPSELLFSNSNDLWNYIKQTKIQGVRDSVDTAIRRKVNGEGISEIAYRANVTPGAISGKAVSNNEMDNFLAWQNAAENKGFSRNDMTKIFYEPKYMGAHMNIARKDILNPMRLDAELFTHNMAQAASDVQDNAAREVLGNIYGNAISVNIATGAKSVVNHIDQLATQAEALELVQTASRYGSAPGLFTYAKEAYGKLNSWATNTGTWVNNLNRKVADIVRNDFAKAREILIADPEAAAEFSITNELVRRRPKAQYTLSEDNKKLQWVDANGENIVPPIEFKNPNTGIIWAAHIGQLDEVNSAQAKLGASIGLKPGRTLGVAYGIPPDINRAKYFALVQDPSIAGEGRMTMIHATSAARLKEKVADINAKFPEFNVYANQDTKDFFKAKSAYEYQKSINESSINSALSSKGVMSDPFPRTEGRAIADSLESFHSSAYRKMNMDIVRIKYDQVFNELESLARVTGKFDSSKFPDLFDAISAPGGVTNPFLGYIKTALNISNRQSAPMLAALNDWVDSGLSRMYNRLNDLWKSGHKVDDDVLAKVNGVFEHYGHKPAYYDAATYLLANSSAERAVATRFIRAASTTLATTFLRFDPFNALVNRLGSTVLTSTEMVHVLNAIKDKNPEFVGRLAGMTLPGTGDVMTSYQKLVANSLERFWKDSTSCVNGLAPGTLKKAYAQYGADMNFSEATRRLVGDMVITGDESTSQLASKTKNILANAGNFLEKWSGNQISEQMNRFIAADIMTQLTDEAIRQGVMSRTQAGSYIRTFVNRTQVNYNGAQKPLLFQGPIGTGLGLFQSYQFNLMNQLFRYVADGDKKALATFAGLQGTFFGLNGVPGFQAMNKYVMGLSGNEQSKGLDDLISEGTSRGAASFMLYGMPSNLLRSNLYARGDATPQNPLVLPTNPVDFPIINMWGKFFGNLKQTANNIMQGADLWPTFLAGLEHNSINRPLSGIAQVLRGVTDGSGLVRSTNSAGNFIAANDLYSLATLGRLAGGKPLDEVVVRNEMYKQQGIRADQRARLKSAEEALKVSMSGGDMPDPDQITKMFETFTINGMNAKDFQRWIMKQYTLANSSQVSQIKSTLTHPLSQRMQELLGAQDLK